MDAYPAIADPVRRAILEQLRERPAPAGAIAAAFAITRPAVSRHLRVLRLAGLVSVREQGRERVYALETGPLGEVRTWLDRFDDHWAQRLDALTTEVHRTRRERERRSPAVELPAAGPSPAGPTEPEEATA